MLIFGFPEFQLVLSNLGISVDGNTVDLVMQIFDMNNNKVLDFEEFVVLYIFLKELAYPLIQFEFFNFLIFIFLSILISKKL
jgi:hypothetical protein